MSAVSKLEGEMSEGVVSEGKRPTLHWNCIAYEVHRTAANSNDLR